MEYGWSFKEILWAVQDVLNITYFSIVLFQKRYLDIRLKT